jgi:uncharacterized membrane protein YqaE (UPF0057 family)
MKRLRPSPAPRLPPLPPSQAPPHRCSLGLIILSIFLPPLAVFLETTDGCETLINVILFLVGYVPGLLHARK